LTDCRLWSLTSRPNQTTDCTILRRTTELRHTDTKITYSQEAPKFRRAEPLCEDAFRPYIAGFVTLPPRRCDLLRSVCLYVCVSVCPLAYLKKTQSKMADFAPDSAATHFAPVSGINSHKAVPPTCHPSCRRMHSSAVDGRPLRASSKLYQPIDWLLEFADCII